MIHKNFTGLDMDVFNAVVARKMPENEQLLL